MLLLLLHVSIYFNCFHQISTTYLHLNQSENLRLEKFAKFLSKFPAFKTVHLSMRPNTLTSLDTVDITINALYQRNLHSAISFMNDNDTNFYNGKNGHFYLHHMDQSSPNVFIVFYNDLSITFLNLVEQNYFHTATDILIIAETQPSNINITQFDNRYPNFLPRHAFQFSFLDSSVFILNPFQSHVEIENFTPIDIKLKWKRISDISQIETYKISTLLKSFALAFVSINGLNYAAIPNGRLSCVKRETLSPWIYKMDALLLCELLNRLNISGRIFKSYKYPSFSYGALSKSFTPLDLFATGHNVEIKFIVPVELHGLVDFRGMLGPISISVMVWTLTFAVGLITFLYVSVTKFGLKIKWTNSLSVSVELVIRPVLDQCLESFPIDDAFLRIVLSPWLFYCLIISETYRGELVSYLMHPPTVEAPSSFQ